MSQNNHRQILLWVLVFLLLFALFVFFQLVIPAQAAGLGESLVINEVMPNPAAASDKSEWVEIFNPSAADIDIRGWSLDAKVIDATDPVIVPAQGFLIVTKDLAEFHTEFGNSVSAIVLAISLNNTGDTISLTNGQGYADTITYPSSQPNRSFERTGPLCSEVALHPDLHTLNVANLAWELSCWPQTESPLLGVEFSLNGQDWTEELSALGPASVHVRPVLAAGIQLQSSKLFDSSGVEISNPWSVSSHISQPVRLDIQTSAGNFSTTSLPLTIFPNLRINEFMPNPQGSDTGREWLEIYNPGSSTVQLTAVSIHDQSGQVFAFSAGDTIQPKQYLVVHFPRSVLLNCTTNSNCQDGLTLKFGENLIIDTTTYTNSASGQSWSLSDKGVWVLDWQVTMGALNKAALASTLDVEQPVDEVEAPSDSAATNQGELDEASEVLSAEVKTISTKLNSSFGRPNLTLNLLPTKPPTPKVFNPWMLLLFLSISSGCWLGLELGWWKFLKDKLAPYTMSILP